MLWGRVFRRAIVKKIAGLLIALFVLEATGFILQADSLRIDNKALAAEVTIDATTTGTAAEALVMGSQTVFVSDQVGYKFYVNSTGACVYKKTNDGGTSWSVTEITYDAQTDCLGTSVWYDQWTPGDTSGTFIHILTYDSSADDTFYNRLDTTSDTLLLGTAPVSVVTNSGQGGTLTAAANFGSIAKGTDGTIYISMDDNTDSYVVECSASCNLATSWTETGISPQDLQPDSSLLQPLAGGNMLLINRDLSADDLRSKVWNNGTGLWSAAWTTIDANAIENATYDPQFTARVDKESGNIFLVYIDNSTTGTLGGNNDDIKTAIYNGSTWSLTNDVVTDSALGLTQVSMGIDPNNQLVYVAYAAQTTPGTAATANVYWATSTYAMTSWGASQGPVNTSAGDIYGVDINGYSNERVYVSWYSAAPDDIFGDTLADTFPVTLVSSIGSQVSTATIPSSNVYVGGAFSIKEGSASRNVTSISITENGTVNGATGVNNIRLYYEYDLTAPYNCASESYAGTESQYGSTDTNGFSGADGVSSFSASITISPTQTACLYAVVDITASSSDGQTLELAIANPTTDIVFSGSPSVSPATEVAISGATTLQNAELTQTHYHWLNDDGVPGSATSVNGTEDSTAGGFANGTNRRLRLQVSNEGSISSSAVQLRLEYGAKITTCSDISTWVDVGAGGGDWDMSDSAFITDGNNSTDLAPASGGTTNENTTHLTPNGALRDTSSQLGSLTFGTTNFLEAEFSIQPTVSAPQGTTYCFRLTDAGTPLRNYSIYPEGSISADVEVTAIGSQTSTVNAGASNQYIGGTFVISRPGTTRTVTDITITETGTIDAVNDISNVRLFYEIVNGDCTLDTYNGTETQFGSTDTDGFSDVNGSSTFSGSVNISSTQTMCVYVVLDVDATASNGDVIEIQISDPSSEVVVTTSSVAPNSTVELPGSTTVSASILTQTHYHWRNDDGSETGATSATGGVEDTPLSLVPKESPRRLRIQVSNEGAISSPATVYRLEFGTKVTTCDLVSIWNDVGDVGGAWDMSLSANIADGNTTDITLGANGAITNENTTFVGTGALRESTSESGFITLSNTEFTELEYSIVPTTDSGYGTTYCFRVTSSGTEIDSYLVYPELTTRPRQDFYTQRGEITISGTTTVLFAGIDYDEPSSTSSAFVRITNHSYTGAGRADTGANNQQADDVTAYIEDQSDITNSFRISRPPGATNNTRVAWEIIEYIGLAGTDNEMIVRDVGDVFLPINDFFATTSPVSGITDDSDVAVFITGYVNYSGSTAFYNDGLTTADWSAGTDEAVFERADADADIFVSYAVVEFTGQNWGVQRIEHQYTAAGSPETETITAIPNVTKGFVHAQKRVGEAEQGLDEYGHQVFISSLGAVTFQLRSGVSNPNLHTSVAWIISNTQSGSGEMTVYQASGVNFTGADITSVSIQFTADPGVNILSASIFGTHDTAGTGTAYPRSIAQFYLASSTHFEIWRSNSGQQIDYRVEVVEWPATDTGIRQNYYRFYVDNDAITPTDPWPVGGVDLGENTSITATDEPLAESERVRIRMSLRISNSSLPGQTATFKLQYGLQDTTCSAISAWTDVGAPGSGAIWRGYNATPIDGTEVATSTPATGALKLSISDVAGTYEEANDSAVNPYSVAIGEDVEYDWLVEHNGAAQRANYCFRMVESNDTEFDGYINYPVLRTTGYTPVIADWRWYDDELNETPETPLATENVAPVDIAASNVVKLRTVLTEVENTSGLNLKFAIQYSRFADFSDGGVFVTATTSCTPSSVWCYADGAGIDNQIISTTTISSADTCVLGVGNGCGTHNEEPFTSSTHTQPAGSSMEFEFTLQPISAGLNNVYYFRLYDNGFAEPITASSSYPSLVTEGAKLSFTVSGINAGQTVAGVDTDATTTATGIPFGTVTFGNSYEAAQQISINTNATEGYQLLMYATQQLTNAFGDTILPITSTNASPAGWSTACDGIQLGCMGYHTTDATLFGGSSRFSPTDSYAALSTIAEEIMYSSIPSNDTHEIVYRLEFNQLQPPGDYETEIVYIAVPVF